LLYWWWLGGRNISLVYVFTIIEGNFQNQEVLHPTKPPTATLMNLRLFRGFILWIFFLPYHQIVETVCKNLVEKNTEAKNIESIINAAFEQAIQV
jgi:hypothetical protein